MALMNTNPNAYVTTAQAAVQLQVTQETVAEYARRGWLAARKVGRGWRIEAESVTRLLRCGPPAH